MATSSIVPDGAPTASSAAEEYSLELSGWRLNISRLFWIVAAFVNAIAFLAGLPRTWTIATDLSERSIAALNGVGLAPYFPAIYLLILDSVTFVIYFVVAVIIFRLKNTERLAIVTSLMLIFTGMLYTAPGYEAHVPVWLISGGAAFAETFQIAFLLLFPTGRYYPDWSWMALPAIFFWRWWVWGTMYIPWLYAAVRTGDNYPFLRQQTTDLLLFFLVVLVALLFQVRRFRRLASRSQRQQAKWLVWSAGMAIVLVGGYVLAINVIPALQPQEGEAVIFRLVGRTMRQLALCLIPLAMLRAILRFRLYDIDFVINRSLVYVPVTSVLAGIFAAVASMAQRFFVATTGQNSDIAVIISTVVVTALFQPVRSGIQSFVDNRMKETPDNFRSLNQFDGEIAAVANAIDVRVVLERLLNESVRASDAVGGAVFQMVEGAPTLVSATKDWHGPIRMQFPISHREAEFGWLALGMRKGGAPYLTQERERLAASAEQTGRLIFLLEGLAPKSHPAVETRPASQGDAYHSDAGAENTGAPPLAGIRLPLP